MFEPITIHVVDFADDFVAGLGEVVVRLGGFVDEDERGFVADADAMKKLARKAGVLDEPAGIDFVAVFAAINGVALGLGEFGLFVGEVDVFEERTRAGLV